MRYVFMILTAAAFGLVVPAPAASAQTVSSQQVSSQTASAPDVSGQTPVALKISVKAVNERFYAGPYAKYAARYLGIDAVQNSGASTRLIWVSIVPEAAGPSVELSRSFGKPEGDRADFSSVPLLKSCVGQRSVEMAAAQTADQIMTIRQKRHQIITGDTDMSLSGETLRLTLEEFARQEKELLKMFLGYTVTTDLEGEFTVLPKKEDGNRLYVAFRISDNGLFPAEHLEGRMVTLELTPLNVPEKTETPADSEQQVRKKTPKGKVLKVISEYVPAECGVKLRDGVDVLLQGVLTVPQLGYETVREEFVPAK